MIDQALQWALPACPDAHALPIDYRPVGLMGWLGCVQLPPNTAWWGIKAHGAHDAPSSTTPVATPSTSLQALWRT